MASLVILLMFSFIQCLSREMEGKGGGDRGERNGEARTGS